MRMHHLCTSVNWAGRPCQMIFAFAISFLNLFTWAVSRAQMLVFLACVSWLWQYVYFKWLDQQAYLGYYPWRPLSFPALLSPGGDSIVGHPAKVRQYGNMYTSNSLTWIHVGWRNGNYLYNSMHQKSGPLNEIWACMMELSSTSFNFSMHILRRDAMMCRLRSAAGSTLSFSFWQTSRQHPIDSSMLMKSSPKLGVG